MVESFKYCLTKIKLDPSMDLLSGLGFLATLQAVQPQLLVSCVSVLSYGGYARNACGGWAFRAAAGFG